MSSQEVPKVNINITYNANFNFKNSEFHINDREETLPFSIRHRSSSTTAPRQRFANFAWLPRVSSVRLVALCIAWYSCSAFTNNFGKQFLNEYRFPMTLTICQFAFNGLLSILVSTLRLGFGSLKYPSKKILMTTFPLALFQIAGHILSSIAISRLPVSFAHTIKALSPLFTVLAYRFFFNVMYSNFVYIALLPLTFGVMLVCLNKITFNLVGVICALASTLIFVVQNIVTKSLFSPSSHLVSASTASTSASAPKLDKLNLLFYSSALAFVLMSPIWIASEAASALETPPSASAVHLLLANAVTHFCQNLLAFTILSLVSPVTYSIASLVKRIYVIAASIVYFSDAVSPTQYAGICLTFVGLVLYNRAKLEVSEAAVLDVKPGMREKRGDLPPSYDEVKSLSRQS